MHAINQHASAAETDSLAGQRLIAGANASAQVGEVARELGRRRVLLISDPGVVRAGHVSSVERSLTQQGLAVFVFSDTRENPTTIDVQRCLQFCQSSSTSNLSDVMFVAVGGGSAIDTAKGANFLLTNGGAMRDYQGKNKASVPLLPMIAIPTTAGTGSECQSAAVIADALSHEKFACLDPSALPCVAILDPLLTLSMPPRVTACTGIDALVHAIETSVTTARTPASIAHAHRAAALLFGNLGKVFDKPDDIDARAAVQLGAATAGMAIELSMLGAAHAAANPLTAKLNLAHGHAVGLMLPHVIRFNAADEATAANYADLALAAGLVATSVSHPAAVASLLNAFAVMMSRSGLPTSLRSMGVDRSLLTPLSADAALQWTARFNPRPITTNDFARLYESAWTGSAA
jgi:alcohol dehydrogenase